MDASRNFSRRWAIALIGNRALAYSVFEHVSKILDENAMCFTEIFPTECGICGMTLQDYATVTSVLHNLKHHNPSNPL